VSEEVRPRRLEESVESLTGANLPFRTPDLPGIGGRIRVLPEDFRVTELPAYEPVGRGPHLYVSVTRTGHTTPEVADLLAQALNADKGAVGYAGLKDKRACTTQTFSVLASNGFVPDEEWVARRLAAETSLQVNWMRCHGNKLRTGHLRGNRFDILVRYPDAPPEEAVARAQAIADALGRDGLPNWFGPQRFGHEGRNVIKGWRIVHRGWRAHRRWLHKLLLSAYQSWLCNRYLSLRMHEGLLDCCLAGDVARKHETGGMFLVEDAEADSRRQVAGEISFTAPMYGHKMWAAEGIAGELEERILAEQELIGFNWRQGKVTGTRRTGRLVPSDLSVWGETDGIRLSFSLPKGGYATAVLREVMKVGNPDLAED